jgi:hypothetical protein
MKKCQICKKQYNDENLVLLDDYPKLCPKCAKKLKIIIVKKSEKMDKVSKQSLRELLQTHSKEWIIEAHLDLIDAFEKANRELEKLDAEEKVSFT